MKNPISNPLRFLSRPRRSSAETLRLAALSGYMLCSVASAITSTNESNFNGTPITAGDSIWFSSHFKLSGVTNVSLPLTIYFQNGRVDFTANSVSYSLGVPNAAVTFLPGSVTPSTTFSSGLWSTVVSYSDAQNDPFLSGFSFLSPGLPGGINPVSWRGDFSSDRAGVIVQWQWAAAVYHPALPTDYNQLGVQVEDGAFQSGTPVSYRSDVIGGARGGGGSNYTGSNSGTESITVVPEPSTSSLMLLSLVAKLLYNGRQRLPKKARLNLMESHSSSGRHNLGRWQQDFHHNGLPPRR